MKPKLKNGLIFRRIDDDKYICEDYEKDAAYQFTFDAYQIANNLGSYSEKQKYEVIKELKKYDLLFKHWRYNGGFSFSIGFDLSNVRYSKLARFVCRILSIIIIVACIPVFMLSRIYRFHEWDFVYSQNGISEIICLFSAYFFSILLHEAAHVIGEIGIGYPHKPLEIGIFSNSIIEFGGYTLIINQSDLQYPLSVICGPAMTLLLAGIVRYKLLSALLFSSFITQMFPLKSIKTDGMLIFEYLAGREVNEEVARRTMKKKAGNIYQRLVKIYCFTIIHPIINHILTIF